MSHLDTPQTPEEIAATPGNQCPDCKGMGRIAGKGFLHGFPQDVTDCPTCNGTGRIEQPTELPKLKRKTETVPFKVGEVKPRDIGGLDDDGFLLAPSQSSTTVDTSLLDIITQAILKQHAKSVDGYEEARKVLLAITDSIQGQTEKARLETMAHVLLSTPDHSFTVTAKAIREYSDDMRITVQPDSRLSGALVYKLGAKK